ncbi:hypothetical protein SBRY_40402 [Actinacidiphila bryophytorum]|uniref:Uncharacterized protein n=1 Tax=Actinacidiphila bryophytorum TaxID=1436133 RepID=A0A9W4H2M4_9ACTN|nr:hypothetical protein SBRY_40402 [Actinacidiphila bryophytorum]
MTSTTPSTCSQSRSTTGIRARRSTVPRNDTRPSVTATTTSSDPMPNVRSRMSPLISSRMTRSRRRNTRSRSARLTMPTSRPVSSTTGSRLTLPWSIARAACTTVHSGCATTAGLVISPSAVVAAGWMDASTGASRTAESPAGSGCIDSLRSRSASETTPSGRSAASTTGTAVMSWSARVLTTSLNGVRAGTRTTEWVIRSLTVLCFIMIPPPAGTRRPDSTLAGRAGGVQGRPGPEPGPNGPRGTARRRRGRCRSIFRNPPQKHGMSAHSRTVTGMHGRSQKGTFHGYRETRQACCRRRAGKQSHDSLTARAH